MNLGSVVQPCNYLVVGANCQLTDLGHTHVSLRLPSPISIMHAETVAIVEALPYKVNVSYNNFMILTDCEVHVTT